MTNIVDLIVKKIKFTGNCACLHKPGAVRLDGYPLLVHAPSVHGPGIRTEDKGVKVEDIAAEFAVNPSHEAVAAKFGTTDAHVADAIRYAVAAGAATVEG